MTVNITSSAAAIERPQPWRRTNLRHVLCVIAPLAVFVAPLPLETATHTALAITSFMILAWMTEIMDPALVGLIGCYLYWALRTVPFEVAFSGFAADTAWFAYGATDARPRTVGLDGTPVRRSTTLRGG